MKVVSDLTFSVAAPGRAAVSGTVRAAGNRVTVETTDPRAVLLGLTGQRAVPSGLIRAAGEALHHEGVAVTVQGPRGRVATMGAGVDSRLGRLLTGSRRVDLGHPRATAPVALLAVRQRLGTGRIRLQRIGRMGGGPLIPRLVRRARSR